MRVFLAVLLLVSLSACGSFGSDKEESFADERVAVEQMYNKAKTNLDKGNYESAIKQYESLQARYPYGQYAQQALLETAYGYYKMEDTAAGLATVDRFIKMYPNHKTIDYAYYLRGLIHFDGETTFLHKLDLIDPTERDPKAAESAFAAFKDLVARYPNSKYAPDAKVRMQYLINVMAKYELHVARYYMRRGAYIAAANRAKGVVSKFPASPQTYEALIILVKAYDQLGMTDLRDDAQRVLDSNQIPQPKNQQQDNDKAWWQIWK